MDEHEVQQLIRLEAPKHGCYLMRNNSGALKDSTGRTVRFGLANDSKEINKNLKSSDLIGINSVGLFVAVEVKKENWKYNPKDEREVAQLNFINFIRSKGGLAGFANSVEQFLAIIMSR